MRGLSPRRILPRKQASFKGPMGMEIIAVSILGFAAGSLRSSAFAYPMTKAAWSFLSAAHYRQALTLTKGVFTDRLLVELLPAA